MHWSKNWSLFVIHEITTYSSGHYALSKRLYTIFLGSCYMHIMRIVHCESQSWAIMYCHNLWIRVWWCNLQLAVGYGYVFIFILTMWSIFLLNILYLKGSTEGSFLQGCSPLGRDTQKPISVSVLLHCIYPCGKLHSNASTRCLAFAKEKTFDFIICSFL